MEIKAGSLVRCLEAVPALNNKDIYEVLEVDGYHVRLIEFPSYYFLTKNFEAVQSCAPMQDDSTLNLVFNEQIYAFDIDDTLVLYGADNWKPAHGLVEFVDPYTDATVYLRPHVRHMELLVQMKKRGRHILVWSAGGASWAHSVIKRLGLEAYVDTIMTKPIGYVDDMPANKWMNNRIYIEQKGTGT